MDNVSAKTDGSETGLPEDSSQLLNANTSVHEGSSISSALVEDMVNMIRNSPAKADQHLDAKLKAMQSRILVDLVTIFNRKVQDFFFSDCFDDKLQRTTNVFLSDAKNCSMQDTSVLDTSQSGAMKENLNSRMVFVEGLIDTFNKKFDKIDTLMEELLAKSSKIESQASEIDNLKLVNSNLKLQLEEIQQENDKKVVNAIGSLVNNTIAAHYEQVISPLVISSDYEIKTNAVQIEGIIAEIEAMKSTQKEFMEQVDKNLASNLAEEEQMTSPAPNKRVNDRLSRLEAGLDGLEQYGRLELLGLEGIKQVPGEDTTDVVIDFLHRYLGIDVTTYDISVSHRMVIPPDKKKYGRDYIPPIYCKFLNRSLVHLILSKRHLLNNFPSHSQRQKMAIEENLTLIRRSLRDRVKKELPTYRFKWVHNGNVMVRKDRNSRAIKVNTEDALQRLIEAEKPRSRPFKSSANRALQKKDAEKFDPFPGFVKVDDYYVQLERPANSRDINESVIEFTSSDLQDLPSSGHQKTSGNQKQPPIQQRLLAMSNLSLHTSKAYHPSSFATASNCSNSIDSLISKSRKLSEHM